MNIIKIGQRSKESKWYKNDVNMNTQRQRCRTQHGFRHVFLSISTELKFSLPFVGMHPFLWRCKSNGKLIDILSFLYWLTTCPFNLTHRTFSHTRRVHVWVAQMNNWQEIYRRIRSIRIDRFENLHKYDYGNPNDAVKTDG